MILQKKYKAFYKDKNKKSFLFCKNKLLNYGYVEDDNNFDFIFTIGGDGTFLYASNFIAKNKLFKIPVLALNCGQLGFLLPFNIEDIDRIIKSFDKLKITKIPLNAAMIDNKEYFFVNDIVVSNNSKIIDSRIIYKDNALTKQKTSGYIISSPIGSFAYNKSNNGCLGLSLQKYYIISPIAPINNVIFHGFVNSIILDNNFFVELFNENIIVIDGHQNLYNCKKIENIYNFEYIKIFTLNTRYIEYNIINKIIN